ncbi:hypothetical protein F4861DRAFT_198790 [Xylaria intraflava]|nr:hypothetical protein F4861DRAFT_198790 [Xylaria intraflava]
MSSNTVVNTGAAHSKVHSLAERYNNLSAGSTSEGEPSTEPKPKMILTGEFRVAIRQRIQELQRSKEDPTPLRPSTPLPNKRIGTMTPQTPPQVPATPECPGAPRKNKVCHADLLYSRCDEDDNDILLDRKVNDGASRLATFLEPGHGASPSITPVGGSPLRQSWNSDDLTEINAKLQALLFEDDTHDEAQSEETAEQVSSEPVGEPAPENKADE